MLKIVAFVFGIIFIVLGVLGLIPASYQNNMFLGFFPVEGLDSTTSLIEDCFSILAGVVAIWCGLKGPAAVKRCFQVFGSLFLLFAILSLIYGDKDILGLIPNTKEEFWFDFIFAVVLLWLGIGVKTKDSSSQKSGA
ncbi:MAG TPA: DUF4383 domain-containing protein [Rhabdochlamydiaceae bacterium]|nr:DUF4383 domain-containing protein [Rhabdochlamydiaceae bacterium]